jgi:predicted site-specific integrase-resolvase
MTLLTHEEAAQRIHVCAKTLRQLRQQGLIPYVAVTTRKKLYRVEDLDAYLASRVKTEAYAPTERRRAKRLRSAPNVVSFMARRQQRQAGAR